MVAHVGEPTGAEDTREIGRSHREDSSRADPCCAAAAPAEPSPMPNRAALIRQAFRLESLTVT